MNEFDDLEQKLWELEYGLLPDDEASALRQRIASEPDVAAAHGRVSAQSAMVAEAARVEVPRIQLQRTAPQSDQAIAKPTASKPKTRRTVGFEYRKVVNWSIAAAASLLLVLLGFSVAGKNQPPLKNVALVEEKQMQDLTAAVATQPVKIEVEGARVMQSGIENQLRFYTTTPDGVPQAAALKVQMEDAAGNVAVDTVVPTDQRGRGFLVMPRDVVDKVAKLEVAEVNQSLEWLAVPLAKAPESYVTYLTTDRPRYRPGDTVRFRSVTLSKFGLKADREVQVNFAITDPDGKPISNANQSGSTIQGVGSGEFTVVEGSAGGKYTLIAQNSSNLFPTSSRDFYVQPDEARQWSLGVAWDDTAYAPGANPKAKVVVQSLEGKPAAEIPVRVEAYVDGHQVNIPNAPTRTDANGEANLSLQLPAEISAGEGSLNIAPGNEEFQFERIPIRVPKIQVEFCPEGGELAAGISSRVYFYAHDALGRPVTVRGRVLDGKRAEVVNFATQHEGRGVFRFTPQASENYGLEITDPPKTTTDSPLPPINAQSHLVLDCGKGVFGSSEPVVPRITSSSPPENLVVVAKCRDAMVGHVTVAAADFVSGSCDVPLQLAAEASGVIRITVFEHEQPVAERLIFRQCPNRLSVRIAGTDQWYAPASQVQLSFSCVNEKGKPTSAALGVGVVDDELLKLARPATPRMATYFWLFGDIRSPEQLEDANFYVSDSAESQTALDLLLGTQGWRRFERMSEIRLAQEKLATQDAFAAVDRKDASTEKLAATEVGDEQLQARYRLDKSLVDRAADLPFRVDNSASLEKQLQQIQVPNPQPSVAAGQTAWVETRTEMRPETQSRWMVTIACAITVLAFSLLAILLRLASSRRVAIAGVAISAMVLAIATYSHLLRFQSTNSLATDFQSVDAGAVAANAAQREGFGGGAEKYKKLPRLNEAIVQDTEARSVSENAPAPSASAAAAPAVADPAAAPAPIPESASKREPATSFFGTSPTDAVSLGDKKSAEKTPLAPKSAAAPARAPATAPTAPEPAFATPTAPATPLATKSAAAMKAEAAIPLAAQQDLAPPAPARAEAGGVAGKAMSRAKQVAPEKPAASGAKAASDSPVDRREKGTELNKLSVQQESEQVRRQNLSRESTYRQRSAGMGMGRATRGLQVEEQRQKEIQQQVEQKVEAGVAGALAGGMLEKDKTNAFFVRRYAHQVSPKRDADKKGSDYTETVYWNPLLITDANGQAVAVFDLSDAATTYRILVDGHENGRITSSSGQIKTKAE